jgi:antitoxin (DNA-binding transcriptional repressor) of toxin-antitoxin stability system
MTITDVCEAETALLRLLSLVGSGEEIVITRDGVPIARLVPIVAQVARKPGLWRMYPEWESFVYDPSVLAPMTDEELEAEGWLLD